MSKRTDSIRAMFSQPVDEALSADNIASAQPRVSSGSVRSLRDTFSDVERENELLRERLQSAHVAVDLDPGLIDPSPLADRFVEQDGPSFALLKASIEERGQEVPVLVREHPKAVGRYQSAYGHRRVRAARELGRMVRAYVRTMSDEELVVAQGIENSAREDLSFIERAMFAARLEDAGYGRSIVQSALSIDRAEASKLIAVARAIPDDVVHAIGRAPKIGRGRWQALADAVSSPAALKRARAATARPALAGEGTEARFLAVLAAAVGADDAKPDVVPQRLLASEAGEAYARISASGVRLRVEVDKASHPGFADYLVEQLPEIFKAYAAMSQDKDRRRA